MTRAAGVWAWLSGVFLGGLWLGLTAIGACATDQNFAGPCSGVECCGRGFCVADQGVAYCACIRGFHPLALCCVVNSTSDPCAGVACDGYGVCRVEGGLPGCDCDPGYQHLTDNVLICAPIPPLDGGGEDGRPAEADGARETVDEAGASDGSCADADLRVPGACTGGSQSCDHCGTRTCGTDCTWGPCLGEGVCNVGETRGCARCGTETCGSDCTWGSCRDQGRCDPGTSDSCGTDCVGRMYCLDTCEWGGCLCDGEYACTTAHGCPGTRRCHNGGSVCTLDPCAGADCTGDTLVEYTCPGERGRIPDDCGGSCKSCTCSTGGAWIECSICGIYCPGS